ncbi:MAG TPA: response regulator, partial [Verrucomicrobiae bacterium]|nr:response regulator [Verrucomicrobiae bacterium]
QEGLLAARECKGQMIQLVVTDVIMPQMSGKELCDQIHAQLPRIRVLLMSGYTNDALAHHGVLDEDLSFLEKPFSPAGLARKTREVLDRPARSRNFRSNGNPLEPVGV